MINTLNTKILVAILAALAGIATVLLSIHSSQVKAAAAELRQQQALEAQRQHDEAFRKAVEAQKKKSRAYAGNESSTWQHYLP